VSPEVHCVPGKTLRSQFALQQYIVKIYNFQCSTKDKGKCKDKGKWMYIARGAQV